MAGIGALLLAMGQAAQQAGLLAPIQRWGTFYANEKWPNNIPGPDVLTVMRVRGFLTEDHYKHRMRSWGFNSWWADRLREFSLQWPEAEEYIAYAFLRGWGFDYVNSRLARLGLTAEAREIKWALAQYRPGVQDLIRFAVREVFSPYAIEAWGLDEDFPPKFAEEAKKLGMSEEIAKWYWRAHWELPSLTTGFEMFHRGIISRDELKQLMRALDIMPGWRDKLIQLSYAVPTRVDVRRMFEMGVVDADYVYKTHLALGYSPEDARLLTEWVIREYESGTRDVTRTEILNAYRMNVISREQAVEMLDAIGYSREESEFIVSVEDAKQESRELADYIKALKDLYVSGAISEQVFADELDRLDIPSSQKMRILASAHRTKRGKAKLPGKDDLLRWARSGLIDAETLAARLRDLNYPEWAVRLYVREVFGHVGS